MDPHLLISFCNQPSSPMQTLCVMDLLSKNVRWVDLSLLPIEYRADFVGVTGICLAKDQIVIATQGKRPVLALLDSVAAKVITFFPLVRSKDLHSIVFHRGFVYITSTGTNEVYRVPLCNQIFGAEELYWQYPDVKYDRDEVHLNGLTLFNERFIATCFGPRTETGDWGSNGRVFYLDNGSSISDGLRQPHSPAVKEKWLVFAESKLERIYIFLKNKADNWVFQRTFELNGYARGIAFLGQEILVGLSADRKVSRSKKTYVEEDRPLRSSALMRVNIDTGVALKIPHISLLGREIFDILSVDLDCFFNSVEDAVAARISSMEALMISERVIISELINEKRNVCNEYNFLLDEHNELSNKYNSLQAHPFKALASHFTMLIRRQLNNLAVFLHWH